MLQRFIRHIGYVAIVIALYSSAWLILSLFDMLGSWFMEQPIQSLDVFIKSLIGLGVGSFMSFASVLVDIKLEDRQRCKENKKSYSESMSQNDKE